MPKKPATRWPCLAILNAEQGPRTATAQLLAALAEKTVMRHTGCASGRSEAAAAKIPRRLERRDAERLAEQLTRENAGEHLEDSAALAIGATKSTAQALLTMQATPCARRASGHRFKNSCKNEPQSDSP